MSKSLRETALKAARERIGLTLKDFIADVSKAGWTVRVTNQDGQSVIGTCDFCNNRINVSVDYGIATAVKGIG